MRQRFKFSLKQLLFRTLRNVPMSVIALIVGLFTGMLMWFLLDQVQVFRMERIVDNELKAQLEQRANESMIRFENHVYSYLIITRLLSNQIDPVVNSATDNSLSVVAQSSYPPGWSESLMMQSELPPPVAVLLNDPQGKLNYIYNRELSSAQLDIVRQQSHIDDHDTALIRALDQHLYLQITVRRPNTATGQPTGYLRALFPLDRNFLAKSQLGMDEDWSVVALIDNHTGRVVASLDETDIPIGMRPIDWSGHYIVATQALTSIQPEADQYEFATFISQARVERILRQLTILDWRQRFYTATLFVLVFTSLIMIVSSRLNKLVRRMTVFSEKALGVPITSRFRHTGNQLVLLEDWINHFTRLVQMSREEANRRHLAEMRQTEALKAAVMEASLDAIVTLDEKGTIIEFNPAAEALFGTSREEALNLNFLEHFSAPNERATIKAFIETDRKIGEISDTSPTHYRDIAVISHSGESVPVDLSLAQIVLDTHHFFTLYIHDIRADKAAAAKIESLARFVRENPDPVLRVDREGRLVDANEPSNMLLNSWGIKVGDQFPSEHVDVIKQVLRNGAQQSIEYEIDQRLFSLLLVPIVDLGYVNIYARDITVQHRAEQAFRQQQTQLIHVSRLQSMGEMATGLAHELNQPLSAIVNYASGSIRRLQNGDNAPETLLPALQQISQQGQRAGEIIRQLRAMVGRQPTQRIAIPMQELVQDALSFLNHERTQQQIDVEVTTPSSEPLTVFADKVQIEQVLINLIANAFDAIKSHASEERWLKITMVRQQDQVYLTLTDSGSGIAAEFLDKVFDAFATTKNEGMGMGLAISKTIVENHEGKIWVTSTLGQGATFHLTLPLYKDTDDLTSDHTQE